MKRRNVDVYSKGNGGNSKTICSSNYDQTNLISALTTLECPHKWKPCDGAEDSDIDNFKRDLERKLNEDETADDETITSVSICLALAHVQVKCEELEPALEVLDRAMSISNTEPLMPFREALDYVIHAERANVFYLKGDEKQAWNEIRKCSEETMREYKYVIKGIEGCVSREYGSRGWAKAIVLIKEARSFETDDMRKGEWNFMLGNILSRQRHARSGGISPTDEEVQAFEDANNILRSASSKLYLANIYLEISKPLMYKDKKTSLQLCKDAHKLCTAALEASANHPRLLSRCATMFLHLSGKYKNVQLAEETYKNALTLSPESPDINHSLGKLYEFSKEDLAQAEFYYERAAAANIVTANLSLISVRWRQDRNHYNPVPEIKSLLEICNDDVGKSKVLIQLGSYYWFVKKDFDKASIEWMAAMELNPHFIQLKKHKSLFMNNNSSKRNILIILENQMKKYLAEEGNSKKKNIFYRNSLRQIYEYKERCEKGDHAE